MADLERAVFLSDVDVLPSGDWSRFYFGAEFCPWRFPSSSRLAQFIQNAHQAGLPVTIATPVLNETFLPRFKEQIEELLPLLDNDDEILASDLGTIRIIRQLSSDTTVVAGRVLSGQKRGPRILDLDLRDSEQHYFRQGRWYQSENRKFLEEQGVNRVELDNLLQGVAPLPEPLVGSLHMPYAMVTSSRNCPARQTGTYGPCSGGCDDVFKLTTPQTKGALYQTGNSQFLYNPELPENLLSLQINRLVEHQTLPR